MKNEFDYQEVPYDFSTLPKRSVYACEPLFTPSGSSQQYIHPQFFSDRKSSPLSEGKRQVPFLQITNQKTIALGITNLLDNVPHKTALLLRRQMVEHFGKTLYYRFLRKENELLPEHQIFIKQLFEQNGINEEPVFDSYRESFDW